MTAQNGYITLSEFRTQLGINDTDTTDDTKLEKVIERASRQVDEFTQRHFYPLYDTYEFDTPTDSELWMWHKDLLEVVTITNGEAGALSSSDYTPIPRNDSPTVALKLVPSSSVTWETDSNSDSLNAISVAGFWGFRQYYSRSGWVNTGYLTDAMASDTTTCTVLPVFSFVAGDLMRIDNEIMLVTAANSGGETITRAYNGTTAAAHDTSDIVYKWSVEPVVAEATMLQAQRLYKRKDAPFGVAGTGQLGQVVAISALDPDVKGLLHTLVRAV